MDIVTIIKYFKSIGFIIQQGDIDENTINRRISVELKWKLASRVRIVVLII